MNSTSCHFWLWAYGSILCMARETITTLCTYLNVNTRSFSLMLHKNTRVPSYRIAWFLNSASKLQWISLLLSVNWKARPSVKENLFSIRKGGNMVSTALAHDSTGLSDAQEPSSPFRGRFIPEKTSQMTCRISNVNKIKCIWLVLKIGGSREETRREQWSGGSGDLPNEASSTGVRGISAIICLKSRAVLGNKV